MKNIYIGKRNASYQQLQGLKDNRTKRLRQGAFFVEGVRNINQAIAAEWKIRNFIYTEKNLSEWAKDTLASVETEINYQLSRELAAKLSGKEDISELMAVVEMKKPQRRWGWRMKAAQGRRQWKIPCWCYLTGRATKATWAPSSAPVMHWERTA